MYCTEFEIGAVAGNRNVVRAADDDAAGIDVAAAVDRLGLLVVEVDVVALPAVEDLDRAVADAGADRNAGLVERDQEGAERVDDPDLVLGLDRNAVLAPWRDAACARRSVTLPSCIDICDGRTVAAFERLEIVGCRDDLRSDDAAGAGERRRWRRTPAG